MKLATVFLALSVAASGVARAQGADTTSYDWLVKSAHDATDRGEFNPSEDQRNTLFTNAEQYARKAIAANPNDAEGFFELARALGRDALTKGSRERVKYASAIYDTTKVALRLNPKHAGALDVMGMWNAEIMRLNGFVRMIAKNLLGGKTFGEASWEHAQADLEEAVSLEPNRIVHKLNLAGVYADRGAKDKARQLYEWIATAPVTDYNDRNYKEEASRRLKDLR